jgi:hypothetical protein
MRTLILALILVVSTPCIAAESESLTQLGLAGAWCDPNGSRVRFFENQGQPTVEFIKPDQSPFYRRIASIERIDANTFVVRFADTDFRHTYKVGTKTLQLFDARFSNGPPIIEDGITIQNGLTEPYPISIPCSQPAPQSPPQIASPPPRQNQQQQNLGTAEAKKQAAIRAEIDRTSRSLFRSSFEREAEEIFLNTVRAAYGNAPVKLLAFKMTNGFEDGGVYFVEFVADVDLPEGANPECAPMPPRGGTSPLVDNRDCGAMFKKEFARPGEHRAFKDRIAFQHSDNGWRPLPFFGVNSEDLQ